MNRISINRPSQIFDTFLDEFFNSPIYAGKFSADISMDVYDDGDNVVAEAKIAGFNEKDLDISIEDNMLTVSGNMESKKEENDEKRKYYYKEISKQSFSRTVQLPARVDASKADANVENGMLKIVMPKLPEAKPNKIKVKTNTK